MSRKKDRGPEAPAAGPSPEAAEAEGFHVVGIGASAGGLGAFEAFLSAFPPGTRTGMAFVLVQHLAPDHKSILADLIARSTGMKVLEVQDGMRVQPECVYVIPPNRDMALLDGSLELLKQELPRGHRLPIDFFFRSLAQDRRERAIGIVLSGTGSDGTLGLKAIKAEGGMVMAQSPESTEYDGMPRSAIATGLMDFVLRPEEMAVRLMAYVRHAAGRPGGAASHEPSIPMVDSALRKIFVLLRSQTGHDFSSYKKNTIVRRVQRRMAVHRIDRVEDYVQYAQGSPAEAEALFQDLLIGVTSFFRDPEAFKVLEERIVPELFRAKPEGQPVRVWVPACSTGEEAYSIAILLQEHLEGRRLGLKAQVFATDMDRRAIEQARAGVYPASIAADVSPERLARFFTAEPGDGGYRIHKVIRDMLVFSEQDVVKDPPFSRLDLISCRNLMIYMGGELQKKLLPHFHYALNPGGVLFLGGSESVGEFVDLFATVDRKWKVYRRKEGAPGTLRPALGRGIPSLAMGPNLLPRSGEGTAPAKAPLQDLVERELLQAYTPASVVVNERGEILYVHGRTGYFLEPAEGEVSMNVLQMAREGLRRELTMALHRVVTRKERVHYPRLRVRTNGSFSLVDLTVRPMGEDSGAGLVLVVFENLGPADPDAPEAPAGREAPLDVDARVESLRQELRAKEEYLQSALEEMQTSNEELRSINEEMQSGNEELQSTNEELETSREELQSVNEELATVNAELQQRLDELSRTNNDMNNLLAGTGVGTIFVDHDLNILRFTPTVTQVINLIQGDVGRPLGHIVSNLAGYDRLTDDVREVLRDLIPRETEVQVKGGGWYLLRIRPYRTLENVIEGAVVIFVDITEQRRMRESLRDTESLRRLAVVVRDAYDAITVQDLAGRILAWNPGAERLYGWTEAEAMGMSARELVPGDLAEKELATLGELARGAVMAPHRTRRLAKDGRELEVWMTATALVDAAGATYAIATTERACPSPDGKAKVL